MPLSWVGLNCPWMVLATASRARLDRHPKQNPPASVYLLKIWICSKPSFGPRWVALRRGERIRSDAGRTELKQTCAEKSRSLKLNTPTSVYPSTRGIPARQVLIGNPPLKYVGPDVENNWFWWFMVMSTRSENHEHEHFLDLESDIQKLLVQREAEQLYGAFGPLFYEQLDKNGPQTSSDPKSITFPYPL